MQCSQGMPEELTVVGCVGKEMGEWAASRCPVGRGEALSQVVMVLSYWCLVTGSLKMPETLWLEAVCLKVWSLVHVVMLDGESLEISSTS